MNRLSVFLVAATLALFTACERHNIAEVESLEGHHAHGEAGPHHDGKPAAAYQDNSSAHAPLQQAPTAHPEGQAASSNSGGSREKPPAFFPKEK